jgi:hypothetical protein
VKRVRLLALAVLFVIVGCGGSTAKPTWMPTNCEESAATSAQHPARFAFSCDGHEAFTGVHWSNWGQDTAVGTGTLSLEGQCVPSCSAAPVYQYHVRLVASQVALCGPQGAARRIYGLVTAYLSQPDYLGDRTLSARLISCVLPTATETTTPATTTAATVTPTATVAPYTTVDPMSAENVIKSNIGKFGSIQAKFVSCPSGVEKVDGAKFDCQVTLVNTSTGAQASGTITLHIGNGGQEATFSSSDINVK